MRVCANYVKRWCFRRLLAIWHLDRRLFMVVTDVHILRPPIEELMNHLRFVCLCGITQKIMDEISPIYESVTTTYLKR